jgi:hypothetical protein
VVRVATDASVAVVCLQHGGQCCMSKPVVPKMCFADPVGSAEHFSGYPLVHYCNGYFEIYRAFNERNSSTFVLKNNRGTSYLGISLFPMTVTISS